MQAMESKIGEIELSTFIIATANWYTFNFFKVLTEGLNFLKYSPRRFVLCCVLLYRYPYHEPYCIATCAALILVWLVQSAIYLVSLSNLKNGLNIQSSVKFILTTNVSLCHAIF